MNLSPLSIALHLFLFFIITFSTADVSINCGSSGTSAATDGRQWLGDSLPKLSNSLVQLNGVSTTSTIANKLSSADPVPHKTARLSRSRFSYAIQVNPGQIIILLHFNPSPYKGFKGLNDLFTVEVGPFTLLSNFSASIRAAALGVNTFAKEFYICIEENQTLSITFSSVSSSQSRDATFAFINGIEIISVPMHLSYFKGGDIGVQVIGKKSLIYVDSSTALELIHRLNAKQDSVLATDEFDDVLGVWGKVPNPKENESNNLTWITPVDIGFRYFVRIHFSNMGLKKALSEGVIFKVQINGKIVDSNVDILEEKEDHGILRYRDYMLAMKGRKQEGKRDLLISFQSYDEFMDGYKLIKGFEIFKLSNTDNSLSSPNALSFVRESQSLIIRNLEPFVGYRNAIVTVVVSVVVVVNIIVYMLRVIWEAISIEEQNKPSAKAERLCRHFSLTEIQLATKNFSDGLLIGRGGFGKVYKGLIDRGQTTVAIKRLKSNSRQGALEFLTEIETLSELRHINLVSLIGYCNERGEMILVYDYMSGGTLADHLYKLQRENEDISSLTWKQRLNICIGAGRGLDYLHTGHGVIHRDVKASNILLDETFVAKVSDFGLAKIEDRSTLKTHVSTNVKGTRGYLDPHYMNTCNLTRKSDVYAFGVVLLEVLCGRPPLDWGVSEDERILTMWARDKISTGEADEIVALTLREEITPNSLKTFVGIAQRCLHDEPKNRPTMSQIVLQLEFALDQQDTKQNFVSDEIARSSHNICSSTSDDAMNQSSTSQPTTASTNMQNLLLRPNKQSYRKVANVLSYGRNNQAKSRRDKPSSRLWPWDSFWNRVKASKKIEFSFPEEEICEADLKLPKFDWDTIAAATNQFSSLNQVSLGIYGLVYKAVLPPSGQTVAVKRLLSSLSSRQRVFKNEIALLPYLHHRNIIKLLGYCIHGEERLLVYEFMENTSLLHTWFDEQRKHPPWSVRFKIILGIVQGLIYLHQDSHLRVIHKDLKSANILLDIDMNPKISNFAVAKTLVDYRTEFETLPNAGTHGYMSPEYVMQGIFSVKSDVYSFGIIVLEIISGRTAIEYSPIMETTVSLPEYAWKMWSEKKAVDLVDYNLLEFQHDEVLRCIQVGLLCTEEQPHDRPTMPSVLKMLLGDEPLMDPKKPWPPGLKDSVHISEHRDGVDSNATYEFDDTLER